jgi:uncharacterized protein (DUF1697 family)
LVVVPTHVALLRGINLAGRNRVAMADLRELASSLGHTEVATLVQSGNLVFTPAVGSGTDPPALAAELERAISGRLGVSPRVVVLSRDQLAQVVRDNPYPDEPNPKAVHAVFLTGDPGPELAEAIAAAHRRAGQAGSRDTAARVGRTLFLHTPDGFGRSKLAELLIARTSGGTPDQVAGTARNWSTVTKLLALCD